MSYDNYNENNDPRLNGEAYEVTDEELEEFFVCRDNEGNVISDDEYLHRQGLSWSDIHDSEGTADGEIPF